MKDSSQNTLKVVIQVQDCIVTFADSMSGDENKDSLKNNYLNNSAVSFTRIQVNEYYNPLGKGYF